MMRFHVGILLSLIVTGCAPSSGGVRNRSGSNTTSDAGPAPDAGGTPPSFCELQGLPERAFDPAAPAAFQRRQPAGDFTVSLPFDETFTLSERWTGCESYIFLPHDIALSQSNTASLFTTDVAALIENSPRNVCRTRSC
jgi:hypothetical protein